MNESFWDAHGVEIGPCAIFDIFLPIGKKFPAGKMSDSMFWVPTASNPQKFSGTEYFPDPEKSSEFAHA